MKIFFVSSSRSPWFESQDASEHIKSAPYSVDMIGYQLERLGWGVNWAGWPSSHNPLHLAKLIDAFAPDIIYTYGSTVALHPLLCRKFLCKHTSFKVVHGWDDPYGRIWNELFGWPGKVLMNWMEKRIVKNSDAVVTLSYALQKKGRKWGVECQYIPNGADHTERLPRSERFKLDGRLKLVYTGDKARWKRTEDILKSMRQLPNDVKLYMTGGCPDHVKPYLSENCINLGWVTKEEQFGIMSQADAFVTTSNQDCNAKLQEYLRWQKPILGFDGEANNFFKNGHNALLAKDGDYVPLIKRLLNEPDLGPMLARNAAAEIPVYTWPEIATQFDAYFKNLLKEDTHAPRTRIAVHDRSAQSNGCELHSFVPQRERALSDTRRIRVLEEALRAELGRTLQHGARASVREASQALIAAAKQTGNFITYTDHAKYGALKGRRSGESEVYFDAATGLLTKFKNPESKQPIKQTSPDDWLYEHVIHNILFPDTAYDFIGISEHVGEVLIVLQQKNVFSTAFPTDAQIAAHLASLGLTPEDRFFFGNDILAVTDVGAHSDNVLLGTDNQLYFIDPLIRLKRPAKEVFERLVGKMEKTCYEI